MRENRFENHLEMSLRLSDFALINLPQAGLLWVGKDKTINKKIVCDFLVGKGGKTILFDAKRTEKPQFSFSEVNKSPHQIKDLFRFKTEGGCFKAGMVVLFKKEDKVCFFDIQKLWELEPETSLRPEDGIILGDTEGMKLDWDQLLAV